MTELEALEAIYEQFRNAWEALHPNIPSNPAYVPYTFRGETFSPDQLGALGAWARVSVLHTTSEQMTMGSAPYRRWERRGNVFVQLFAPIDAGVALLAQLAEDARAALQGRRLGEMNLYAGATQEVSEDGAWAMSVVVIPFRYTASDSVGDSAIPPAVAAWGDSLTVGLGATTANETFPARLATKAPIRTVHNMGVNAETSTQIKTRLLADTAKQDLPTIIWAGRNNPNAPTTVLADIAMMVAALGHTNYLVLSVINGEFGAAEYVGGATYNDIATINAGLAAAYGSHYVDIRSHLVSRYDPNFAQDVIDHGHDIVPASLRFDPVHLNNKGYQIVATKIWESAKTLFGADPVGGIVGVTRDQTSLKYLPSDAEEWDLFLAAAGVTSGGPVSVWPCVEPTATNLTDFDDGTTLSVSGAPTGGNSVAGWTKKSINITDGQAASFSTAAVVNLATTSGLLLAWVIVNGSAAAEREILGLGAGFDHRYVALTAAGKFKATGLAGGNATGTATPGTTVHLVTLKIDQLRDEFKVFTDQELLWPAWTNPVAGGALLAIGDQVGSGGAPVGYLGAALFIGAAAQKSDAEMRAIYQGLGFESPW